MGNFLKGLFVGIGVGLFIAPQTGEETRRMIAERVAALRKGMLPEAGEHFAISARSPQVTTSPVEPDQPIAVFSGEPLEQVTPSVPPDQPIAMSLSEPLEQVTTSGAPTGPIVAPLSEPLEQVTTSGAPAEPITTPSSELHEQDTISASPADSESMFSHPNANTAEITRDSADTVQTSGSTTNPHFVPEANSDQPNRPSQTAKRKASARTSHTNRSRGHSKS
jgi:hypothetical protein